ncbi:MAG: hypothetical protein V3U78_08260, partial [Thiotrichaceae bacterium]
MFNSTFKKILAPLVLLITIPVSADDTEALARNSPPPPPNILFLMDLSNSMNTPVSGDSLSRNRIQVLRDTFNGAVDVMDSSIKVGIMSYGGGSSFRENGVSFPVSPLTNNATDILTQNLLHNDTTISPTISLLSASHKGMFNLDTDNLPNPSASGVTVKDYLKEIVSSWVPYGNTPIPGALYEAARYFKGDTPEFGATYPDNSWAAHPSTYTGSIYGSDTTIVNTESCATEVQCTNKDLSDSSACSLIIAERHTSLGQTNVENCIADATCSAYCSIVPAVAAPAFTSVSIDCTNNANPSCGINCGANKGTLSEPLYQCESTPPAAPTDTYTCSQYYTCNKPILDSQTITKNATYTSPIQDKCDSNFLVLLSDGEPFDYYNYITSRQSNIKSYLSLTDCAALPGEDDATNSLSYGRCAPELVTHLANTDLNTTMEGDQYVNTYTIGFGVGNPSPARRYLRVLAQAGGGRYYSADNAADLTQVFQDLLTNINEQSVLSLAGSGISVDASTQIAHNNDVFIPVMKKVDGQPTWSGNLKKFTLSTTGIVDINDNTAVNNNGTLKNEALDLWSTGANVDPVLSGGAANLLNPVNRKLYTDISGTNNTTGDKGTWGTPLNELKTSNAAITKAMLSVPTDPYRNEVLDYIRGYAIPVSGAKDCTDPSNATVTDTGNCTARLHMGDILHSKPIVVSFDDSDASKRYVF